MQPLAGITVIDFTTLLPGPLATLILAEAGAEVIKVEKPGGEDMRAYPPFVGGMSAYFAALNRGKKSIALDLKTEADRDRLWPLIEQADVLVEQFRPGVMDRLGLGYDAVKARNPGIVYCAITGYGQSGPRAEEAGHDLNYTSLTGLLALSHGATDRPVLPPALIADIGGGSFPAVTNILLALLGRQQTGQGAYLDIAMADAMFTYSVFSFAEGTATGRFPENGKGMLMGGLARYALYPTADGRLAAVAALEPKFWQRFCDLIALPKELRNDFADPAKSRATVAAIIAGKTAAEWAPLFAEADCCVTIMRSLDEARTDPHFIGRGLFSYSTELPDGSSVPAAVVPIAPEFRASEKSLPAAPAGADNDRLG